MKSLVETITEISIDSGDQKLEKDRVSFWTHQQQANAALGRFIVNALEQGKDITPMIGKDTKIIDTGRTPERLIQLSAVAEARQKAAFDTLNLQRFKALPVDEINDRLQPSGVKIGQKNNEWFADFLPSHPAYKAGQEGTRAFSESKADAVDDALAHSKQYQEKQSNRSKLAAALADNIARSEARPERAEPEKALSR